MKKPKGYILLHPNLNAPYEWRNIPRMDILVHRDHYDRYKHLKEGLYRLECPWADKFKRDNPDYIYLGSEDLLHSFGTNVGIICQMADLIKEGFEITSMSNYE